MNEDKKRKKGPTATREAALLALREVESQRAYASTAIDRALARTGLGATARPVVTELVYGTLRQRGLLDWYLKAGSGRRPVALDPWVRNILRLALYECFFLTGTPPAVAVDQAVELARAHAHAGAVRFVNGVLRGILRRKEEIPFPAREEDPVLYLATRYSHPVWLVRLWLEELGPVATEALLAANNQRERLDLRANTLRVTRAELAEELAAEGWVLQESFLVPEVLTVIPKEEVGEEESQARGETGGGEATKKGKESGGSLLVTTAFRAGHFFLQDEAAALVAHILAPQPGQELWDMASAPGGKTTHLAALMGNRGRILATDPYPRRLQLVEENCARLGVEIVIPVAADARTLPGEWAEWQADKVLLDAPCSGLGVLRGRPDLRWHKTLAECRALPPVQLELLEAGAQRLRPGGELCYSTCTLHRAENEGVIEAFLVRHPEFRLLPFPERLPTPGARRTLGEEAEKGWVRLLPSVHGTAGFFIALLRKGF